MTRIKELYDLYLQHPSVTTDTRDITSGSLFFALKGENFDGNSFASEALDKGASWAIIDDQAFQLDKGTFLVEDTLNTLQELASYHRSQIHAKVLAITGTNGKTTTKELIGIILGSSFRTNFTRGNLNNHIGVPLTLLSIDHDTEMAVVEMGANHEGEIARLCEIARPDYGIITNFGRAHLEGFGSFEGVVRAKSELFAFMRANQGIVFVNEDDELMKKQSEGITRITYGTIPNAQCRGEIVSDDPYVSLRWYDGDDWHHMQSRLYGDYNSMNIMAAVCIGKYFKVDAAKICEAVERYVPQDNRSQTITSGQNTIIMDAYNANPTSMKAALDNFSKLKAEHKTAILGDMLELGEESYAEHVAMLRYAINLDIDHIYLVGPIFSMICTGPEIISFRDTELAWDYFRQNPVKGHHVLIKGSRKIKLEKLLSLF